jgi:hypothetical protein
MPFSYRWIIAGIAGTLLGLGLYVFRAPSQLKPELASELQPPHPRYHEVICGPLSLSVALGRLGVDRMPSDVASQCRVTAKGVASSDLIRAANATGRVNAAFQHLNWEELRRLDGVAVLFVKGSHYLAVDPREAPPAVDTVRIYEPEAPMQCWSRQKLEDIWGGEAIVITRSMPPPQARQGARIDWEQCYIDQGVVKGSSRPHFRFSFRNVGNTDLVVNNVERSCGCVAHTLSKKQLAPGEAAVFDADLNLNGIEGRFQHYAVLRTNDSSRPTSILRMEGGVRRARVISSDLIRSEDLPRGCKELLPNLVDGRRKKGGVP